MTQPGESKRRTTYINYYNKMSLLCRSRKIEHISVHFRDVRFIRQCVRAVGLNNGKGVKGVSKMTQQWRICLPLRRHRFTLWVRKIPWGREWQPTPVFLSGESHGERSLAGYSPWGRKTVRCDLATEHRWKATRGPQFKHRCGRHQGPPTEGLRRGYIALFFCMALSR